MKRLLTILMVLTAGVALAQTWTFEWDAPQDAPVDGFRLYASTNAFDPEIPPASYIVSVDTGTNTTVSIDRPRIGTLWYFVATAYAKSTNETGITVIESLPSQPLILKIPKPPENLATLAVQWIGTLASTNWTDLGFFRLKIGLP